MSLKEIGNTSSELDVTCLEVDQQYNKICFFREFNKKETKYGDSYYTVFLKDVNGNTVVGNIFNIGKEDYGLYISSLKNKPVRVNFIASVYEGKYLIRVISIEEYSGDIEIEKYIGKIENAQASLTYVNTMFTKGNLPNLPKSFLTTSFASIANGRCGGFIKVTQLSILSMLGLSGLTVLDFKKLLTLFNEAVISYYEYLDTVEELGFVSNAFKLEFISDASRNDSIDKVMFLDTLSSLIGLSKPESLYSNLIFNSVKLSVDNLNLIYTHSSMISGYTREVGEYTLLKY